MKSSVIKPASERISSVLIYSSVLLLAFILSVASCKFTPTGEHYINVDPTIHPVSLELQVSPTDFRQDTIVTRGEIIVQFQFTAEHQRYIEGEFHFDKHTFHQFYLMDDRINSRHQFEIPGYAFNEGVYQLELYGTADTGTGSLSDLTGNEHLQIQRSWIILIDHQEW